MKSVAVAAAACMVTALGGPAWGQSQPAMAEIIDRAGFSARLDGADAQWNLRFVDGAKRASIPARDLAVWGSPRDEAKGKIIVLADGGRLVVQAATMVDQRLNAESVLFGSCSLPLGAIAGVIFNPPADQAARDLLVDSLLSAHGERDRLILENGDQIRGTVSSLGAQSITLEADGVKTPLELSRATALVFDPALVARQKHTGLRAWIGFRDGSRVLATRFVADGSSARITLAAGGELGAPTETIVAVQPLGGRAVYVSDLQAAGYRHMPYLSIAWPYRTDRSVVGTQLRAAGTLFLKGLGMHSAARVTYSLDKPYRRLEGKLAIDDAAGQSGSVTFRVFVDEGSGDWRAALASPVVRGGDAPTALSVDVRGAKRISLLVDFADRADQLDYADWLNLRLVE